MESIQGIRLSTLPNGVRVITENMPGIRSCSIGFWVGTGSRMERNDERGITHFIEHLLFKGTGKRSAKDIAEALDSVGGQINAFTSKEMTCYYARVMDRHLPLAVEVLTDMFFNSSFEDESIDKERGVIKEEISMYEDTPDELIHDVFLSAAWPDTPLGAPVIGTADSLDRIDRDMIKAYISRQYVPERVVIACAGNVDHDRLLEALGPAFGVMAKASQPVLARAPGCLTGRNAHVRKEVEQTQICVGTRGVSAADERNYPLYALNNILGGGISSRLFQNIREDKGLAYSIYSFGSSYSDTGAYSICAGTSPRTAELVTGLIQQEMKSIMTNGVTPEELSRAKEQARGGLYMGLESVSARMNRLGKNLLLLDDIISPETTMKKIDDVALDDIPALAEYLFVKPHIIATIGPMDAFKYDSVF